MAGKEKLESNIPQATKTHNVCAGIDEAGRGPVLGPMVYGLCFCPLSEKERFAQMGFADSKQLSEEKREKLFEDIKKATEFVGWSVEILSPSFISTSMLARSKYNLNALSHDSAIGLVKRALDNGVNITELYVDTVGDPAKYQAKLSQLFPHIQITVAAKADSLFPIVSAASICAKVIRDEAVKNWQFVEALPYDCTSYESYGSGYPGDAHTKEWLESVCDPVFGFPQFVRFSWSTVDKLLERKATAVEWEDDDEDEQPKGTVTLSQFFSKKDKVKKHRFFEERKLSTVQDL
ncbi:ribonuclease H2 subunit A-like [Corticium candelabrum]|uniref:ribonuclease H2 subunit A-like n=1 Tax=Corticium candelabrum TaxID=121492 RepID=UPI002E362705|nr:ribonuclease H2 subunit A-like [Corticium candelabrum]